MGERGAATDRRPRALRSGSLTSRMLAPKPSTIEMIVSARDDRLAHALLQQQLRLRVVRVVRRHELARHVDQRVALRAPAAPARPRSPAPRGAARRDVLAVDETAVAAHAARDQRLVNRGLAHQLIERILQVHRNLLLNAPTSDPPQHNRLAAVTAPTRITCGAEPGIVAVFSHPSSRQDIRK